MTLGQYRTEKTGNQNGLVQFFRGDVSLPGTDVELHALERFQTDVSPGNAAIIVDPGEGVNGTRSLFSS